MKDIKFLIAALVISSCAQAQWEPDFNNAIKRAKEENRLILLNFSGSDWCGPCILFRREYLASEAFVDYAKNNLVLVNADFPRKTKNRLPKDLVERNERLAEVYNKHGDFPYTLLLDADGKVLTAWVGNPKIPVSEWIAEIKAQAKK